MNSKLTNSALTGLDHALELVSEGRSIKYWSPSVDGQEINRIKVTREECNNLANGKPWKLMHVNVPPNPDYLDHPVMWGN